MSISTKTRKILWARSGNRCAICKRELVVNGTPFDDESVVGDECHLASPKTSGPRFDPEMPAKMLDELANLILLCRVHHKMVDDQSDSYTTLALRQLKATHEKWVASRLSHDSPRVRRVRDNKPDYLTRLTSGDDLLTLLAGAFAFSSAHDELETHTEVELVASFLEEVQDIMDLAMMLGTDYRVRTTLEMTARLRELEEAGFWVFGAREMNQLEGGGQPPSLFPVALVKVSRSNNPDIIKIDAEEAAELRRFVQQQPSE